MMQPQEFKACEHRSVFVSGGTGGGIRCMTCDAQLTWRDTMPRREPPQEHGSATDVSANEVKP